MKTSPPKVSVAIIGGGPAGLSAAEVLLNHGHAVHIYDSMPSLGRKFLMAGKSGLNLTHSEKFETFITRYGPAQGNLKAALNAFPPGVFKDWVRELGIKTFVGTSGRVFPKDFKAAPLLRAWLHRLREAGATIHVRHTWQGWNDDGALCFQTPNGTVSVRADATVLALGGASWPKLGSTGAWLDTLAAIGAPSAPLRPANCGFEVHWSDHIKNKFAGVPLKSVRLSHADQHASGDVTFTAKGLESGPVYTLSAPLRDAIERDGTATLHLDLLPGQSEPKLAASLARPRGKKTLATHLKRTAKMSGVKVALLHECLPADDLNDPARLAAGIKNLPLTLLRPAPLENAISTAGGVKFDALDEGFMVTARPNLFCAGEMLDWEAPTGGYLLTACFATGRRAGYAAAAALAHPQDT